MAELDVGKLSLTIEADGRAAIFELSRVKEAAEGASTDAMRAYQNAGEEMAEAFEPVAEAAEEAAERVETVGEKARKTGDAVQTAGTKATKSFKDMIDSADKFGTKMSAAVTAPMIALYGTMVKGASDLTETIGKSEVVFEDQASKVFAWSEDAIRNMGLAEESALNFASTFGDMGKGMDVPIQKTTEMSMNLTQLSADLASFKNMSAERVAQALTGVYTGETEALKSLGIVMTQTNLQAFALSKGITTQVSAMSQAEQVMLRYQYVMEKTADAQGDFVRTGGNLANQGRALVQTLKQAGNAFGSILTPAVTEAVSGLREGALWLAELDEGTKTAIISIGGVVAATGPLILAGTKIVKLVTAMKAAMTAVSLGPVALGVAGVAAAVALLYNALDKANNKIDTASEKYKSFERILSGGAAAKITADTEELDALDGRTVSVQWEVKQGENSDQAAWDDFYAKVEGLGWEAKSFSASGEFDVDPATTEQANAYAEALANAATATSEYDAAVESLNALLDEQLQAQMAQINKQVSDESRKLVAMYNEGLISDEEFDAGIERIVSGAKEAKAALEEQTEAAQKANEAFANGILKDDAGAYAELIKKQFAGASLEAEDMQGAIAMLNQASKAGEDMTQYVNEAKVALNGLKDQSEADYAAMTQAQQQYTTAVENANKSIAEAQTESAQGETLQDLMDAYILAAKFAPSAEEALANVNAAFSEQAESMGLNAEEVAALKQELEALLTTSEGIMSADQAGAEYGDGALFTAYQEQLQQAIADAETAKTTAAETFAATLNDLTGEFSAAETLMLMEMISQTGAAISEADAEMIAATESMIDEMAAAAEDGGAEALDKVSEMIANVGDESANAESEGKKVGAAITAGITQGLQNGTGTLYSTVRSIVNAAITEAKETADIHSPSRKSAQEIGIPFVQGIAKGAEEETPNAVKTIRQSVEHMISGATQVISHGSITIPAMTAAASTIDYSRMGEAMTDAVSALQLSVDINGKRAATIMREDTARQQALRAHEINVGKGRIG